MSATELCKDLPPEFMMFYDHLCSLEYQDRPNYAYLYNLMADLYARCGGDENSPFDWDRVPPVTHRPRYPSHPSAKSLRVMGYHVMPCRVDLVSRAIASGCPGQ